MEVTNVYNGDTNETYVVIKSELLRQYYKQFLGLFNIGKKKCSEAFKGLSLKKEKENTVKIVISSEKAKLPPSFSVFAPLFPDAEPQKAVMSINKETADAIDDLISKFAELASKEKTKTTEFLPLEGYDIEKMKEDVVNAIRNKRNFLIIDSYDSYLSSQSKVDEMEIVYNQYAVEFGTDEYADVALLIYEGDLETLRATYKDKLVTTSWF